MIIMANWWESALKSGMGDNFADIGTAPIPVGPNGDGPHSISYSWMTVVNAKASDAQQKAAWDFLSWLDGPTSGPNGGSAMGDILLSMGILPSRTSDAKAFSGKLGIIRRHGKFEVHVRLARLAEGKVRHDAGHGGGEEVDDAQKAADELGELAKARRRDTGQRTADGVVVEALEAVVVGERDEGAAGMGDADEGAVGDEVQRLKAAVIGMGAPADIGQKAGGLAVAALAGQPYFDVVSLL